MRSEKNSPRAGKTVYKNRCCPRPWTPQGWDFTVLSYLISLCPFSFLFFYLPYYSKIGAEQYQFPPIVCNLLTKLVKPFGSLWLLLFCFDHRHPQIMSAAFCLGMGHDSGGFQSLTQDNLCFGFSFALGSLGSESASWHLCFIAHHKVNVQVIHWTILEAIPQLHF